MKQTGILLLLCLFAMVALADGTNTVVTTVPTAGIPILDLWHALIAVLVPVAVAGIKKVLPSIPKVSWPVVATALGCAGDALAAKAGVVPQGSLALGALCGLAGVGLREVATQSVDLVRKPSPVPPV